MSDPRISSSVEGAEASNRAFSMARAIHRMRGRFFRYEPAETDATVTDIDEARARHPEVVAGGTAGLETQPVSTDAEGKVVDMAGYRRVSDARAKVDEAFTTMPKPDISQLEDLLIK